jgi:hypothetical protein
MKNMSALNPTSHSTEDCLAELRRVFGPPPILSTERAQAFDDLLDGLAKSLRPADFMEKILVWELTVCTWDIIRYSRYKSLLVERQYQQHRDMKVKRIKQAAARKEALEANKPANAFERLCELQDAMGASVDDVDAILARAAEEVDHARALEAAMVQYAQLDALLSVAYRRRNDIIDQLERYRDGLGRHSRKVSDTIIDGECAEVAPQSGPVEAPPLQSEGSHGL